MGKRHHMPFCHRNAFSSKAVPMYVVWQVFWLARFHPVFPYVYGDVQ